MILISDKNKFYRLVAKDGVYIDEVQDCGLFEPLEFEFIHGDAKDVKNGKKIGKGKFTMMPSCNTIVISSELVIYSEYRGKGWSKIFQQLRYDLAKKMGCKKIVATIDMENIPQLVSVTRFGWKFLSTFRNEHTGHTISLIEKEVV